MATKSYSKHKEYREYSSSGTVPAYTDEQFDMIKSDLIPKGSKLNSLERNTGPGGKREYHYEYKEETLPGKYDRKDVHTVELPKACRVERSYVGPRQLQYTYDYEDNPRRSGRRDRDDIFAVEEFTVPRTPKSSETSTYYYEKEERDIPTVTTGTRTYNYESNTSSTPGYSRVKSTKATKDLSHNVEELDSLLDDLQKDQERQLYKSGYTSDTAETSSFDYKRGTPAKTPSSGYSTLKREEHVEKWSTPAPAPVTRAAEVRQEMFREEKHESRVLPAAPAPLPSTVCQHCHHSTATLPRAGAPMNKVTTTVKTYTYEVPADTDPTTVPLPHDTSYVSTDEKYLTSSTLKSSSSPRPVQWSPSPGPVSPAPGAASPAPGCQYCTHCNSHITNTQYRTHVTNTTDVQWSPSPGPVSPAPGAASPAPGCQYCTHCNSHITNTQYRTHVTNTTDVTDRSERIVYPAPANEVKHVPAEPHNGHPPYGPTYTKYSETSYSSSNEHYPARGPRSPSPGGAPFPRATTPSPGNQQPPKRLDDLLADFPEARFPTQPDGVTRRKVEVSHESQQASNGVTTPRAPAVGTSKNVSGPAVYYPPGHTPFAKKDAPLVAGGGYEASSAMSAGGGRYAAGRGMYEYESGSRSKEKHSETKTAVPVCLPLCCAMPCVIM